MNTHNELKALSDGLKENIDFLEHQRGERYLGIPYTNVVTYSNRLIAAATAAMEEVEALKQERDAALGIFNISSDPHRPKLEEWQGCYAGIFRQLKPVLDENKILKDVIEKMAGSLKPFAYSVSFYDGECNIDYTQRNDDFVAAEKALALAEPFLKKGE